MFSNFGIKECNKQTIHSFDINIMQNFGRHEITKVIISSLIIQIETGLCHLAIMFSVSRHAIKQTIHLFDICIMQNSQWPP